MKSKLREIEIEYGFEGELLWPPGYPINKVSENILFREVSPELDKAYEECVTKLEGIVLSLEKHGQNIDVQFHVDWINESLAALKKARGESDEE